MYRKKPVVRFDVHAFLSISQFTKSCGLQKLAEPLHGGCFDVIMEPVTDEGISSSGMQVAGAASGGLSLEWMRTAEDNVIAEKLLGMEGIGGKSTGCAESDR